MRRIRRSKHASSGNVSLDWRGKQGLTALETYDEHGKSAVAEDGQLKQAYPDAYTLHIASHSTAEQKYLLDSSYLQSPQLHLPPHPRTPRPVSPPASAPIRLILPCSQYVYP